MSVQRSGRRLLEACLGVDQLVIQVLDAVSSYLSIGSGKCCIVGFFLQLRLVESFHELFGSLADGVELRVIPLEVLLLFVMSPMKLP